MNELEVHYGRRKIIHVDMDAFYPSVEQRDQPSLRGKPVIVGGDPQKRGVVASASYEARSFGVRSAMSAAHAKRLCPQGVFLYPHFDKYVAASRQIRAIFERFTSQIEPLSLDEAYLDVTNNRLGESSARVMAQSIKDLIQAEVGLTASAGVGPSKWIAKLASDFNKPNGLVVVPPAQVFKFIERLPVEKFWGVGPATARKLHAAGLLTAAEIRASSKAQLEKVVGSFASFLFELAHGRDDREVDSTSDPKSRGTETTFARDIHGTTELLEYIRNQAQEVAEGLKKLGRPGRTITLKIKYSDFTSITRSQTLVNPTQNARLIEETAAELLFRHTEVRHRPVRLIGVSVGNLVRADEPLQLWFDFNFIK